MIILPSGFTLPDNPLIGWQNLVTVSNVSADQEAPQAPVTQLANPATYNPWSGTSAAAQSVTVNLGAAAEVDYIGIARHNLGANSITYHVEHSDDGAAWTAADSGVSPVDDRVILHVFDAVTAQYWRLRFEAGTGPPSMAVLYLGTVLQSTRRIYVGHTPITLGRNSPVRSGRSERGQFLGRVVSRTLFECDVNLTNLDPDWYRTSFDPFAVAALEDPFFFAWRPDTYDQEVAYCWAMRPIVPSNQRPNGMMQVAFPIQGFVGDDTGAAVIPSSS